ncbi:hypothetical protein GCM10009763_06190 [Dermacoccus profundi]|uniref:Uncharacterized protein n=2 Tax=Dermacoccus TaxID=57495 RepID=A0ABN2BF75_9MICO|nr:hypothetical protein [Dermacoccus abyssi]
MDAVLAHDLAVDLLDRLAVLAQPRRRVDGVDAIGVRLREVVDDGVERLGARRVVAVERQILAFDLELRLVVAGDLRDEDLRLRAERREALLEARTVVARVLG